MENGETFSFGGRRLRKIGERHGDDMDDKFKPKTPHEYKKPLYSLPEKKKKKKAIEFKTELKNNATAEEKAFREELFRHNIYHFFQYDFIKDNQFIIADFFIQKLFLVIEIDGGYHNTEKQKQRDWHKDAYYKSKNLNVIRIRNEDVSSFDFCGLEECYNNGIITPEFSSNLLHARKVKEKKQKHLSKKEKNKYGSHKIKKSGDICRHCGTPVVAKKPNKNKRRKGQRYAFRQYFYCPKCRAMYMDNASKYLL